MKNLLNLLEDKQLYFCEKPLPLCRPEEVKLLPVEAINKKMSQHRNNKFQWSNNVFVPDDWQLTHEDQKKLDELIKRMIPSNKFVICFSDHRVGYSVFTRDTIKKGGIIFYSGEIIPYHNEKLVYGLSAPNSSLTANGEKIGGHSSLFQDLYPPDVPLTDFPIEVARNNFAARKIDLSCGSLAYLEATSNINPKTQCGLRYGKEYWKIQHLLNKKVEQLYFSTSGEIIEAVYARFLTIKTLTKDEVDGMSKNNTSTTVPLHLNREQFLDQYTPHEDQYLNQIISSLDSQNKPELSKYKKDKSESKIDASSFNFMKGIFASQSNAQDKIVVLKKYQRQDKNLPTPELALRRAAADGVIEDINFLLDNYKNLNIDDKSSNGMTALDWASQKGRSEIVELLIKNGAKIWQDSDSAKSPGQ